MKVYVAVSARTDSSGCITPEAFTLRGRTLRIDRVLDSRPAKETKQGGQGVRYTVAIGQARLRLFRDDERRWFVEEEEHVRQIPCDDGG